MDTTSNDFATTVAEINTLAPRLKDFINAAEASNATSDTDLRDLKIMSKKLSATCIDLSKVETMAENYFESIVREYKAALPRYTAYASTRRMAIKFLNRVTVYDEEILELLNYGIYPQNFAEIKTYIQQVSTKLLSIKYEYGSKLNEHTHNELQKTIYNYKQISTISTLTNLQSLREQYSNTLSALDQAIIEVKDDNKILNNIVGVMQFVNDLLGSVLQIAELVKPI